MAALRELASVLLAVVVLLVSCGVAFGEQADHPPLAVAEGAPSPLIAAEDEAIVPDGQGEDAPLDHTEDAHHDVDGEDGEPDSDVPRSDLDQQHHTGDHQDIEKGDGAEGKNDEGGNDEADSSSKRDGPNEDDEDSWIWLDEHELYSCEHEYAPLKELLISSNTTNNSTLAGQLHDAVADFASGVRTWRDFHKLVELQSLFASKEGVFKELIVLSDHNVAHLATNLWFSDEGVDVDGNEPPYTEEEMHAIVMNHLQSVAKFEDYVVHGTQLRVLMGAADQYAKWDHPYMAIRLFEAAVRHQPKFQGTYDLLPETLLYSLYLDLEDFEMAYEWQRRCMRRRPKHCYGNIMGTAQRYARSHRPDIGMKMMRIAELLAGYAPAHEHFTRGEILAALGDLDAARKLLHAQTATTGRTYEHYEASAWTTLGAVDLEMGRCLEARQMFFNGFGTTKDMAPRSERNENGTIAKAIWDSKQRGNAYHIFKGLEGGELAEIHTTVHSHLPSEQLEAVRRSKMYYPEKDGWVVQMPYVRIQGRGRNWYLADRDYEHAIFLGDGGTGTQYLNYAPANHSVATSFFSNAVLLHPEEDSIYNLLVLGMSRAALVLSTDLFSANDTIVVLASAPADPELKKTVRMDLTKMLNDLFPHRNLKVSVFVPDEVRLYVENIVVGDWFTSQEHIDAGKSVPCISGQLPPMNTLQQLRQRLLRSHPLPLGPTESKVVYAKSRNEIGPQSVSDEELLIDQLRRVFGFQFAVLTHNETWTERKELLSKAGVFITADGDAVGNILALREDAVVIELPTTRVNGSRAQYLCTACGLRYVVIPEAAHVAFGPVRMSNALARLITDTAAYYVVEHLVEQPFTSSETPEEEHITTVENYPPHYEMLPTALIVPQEDPAEQMQKTEESLIGKINIEESLLMTGPRRRRRSGASYADDAVEDLGEDVPVIVPEGDDAGLEEREDLQRGVEEESRDDANSQKDVVETAVQQPNEELVPPRSEESDAPKTTPPSQRDPLASKTKLTREDVLKLQQGSATSSNSDECATATGWAKLKCTVQEWMGLDASAQEARNEKHAFKLSDAKSGVRLDPVSAASAALDGASKHGAIDDVANEEESSKGHADPIKAAAEDGSDAIVVQEEKANEEANTQKQEPAADRANKKRHALEAEGAVSREDLLRTLKKQPRSRFDDPCYGKDGIRLQVCRHAPWIAEDAAPYVLAIALVLVVGVIGFLLGRLFA